jgi:hypothetical protein
MIFRKLAVALCVALAACGTALAQSARTPEHGSEERAAIMDAIREPAEREFKQKVIFKVERLRVAGEWAYARVSPTKPNGDEIDFSKTKYREQMELGAFDPQGEALLRLEDDGWTIVEWVFGSTDAPSAEWAEKHDLPKSLLR